MKGKQKSVALAITLFLIFAGWLVIEKQLIFLPKHFVYSAQLDTTIRHYDIDTGLPVSTTSATSRLNVQPRSANRNHLHLAASFETRKLNGEKLVEKNSNFRVDRLSWQRVNPENLSIYLFAPRNPAPENFIYKHLTLPDTLEMYFDGEETIEALPLARYTGTYRMQYGEAATSGKITAWFEPVSGYLVKYSEEQQIHLLSRQTRSALEETSQSNYTDISVNNHIRNAKYHKHRIVVGRIAGPATVAILMLMLVLYAYNSRLFGWVSLVLAASIATFFLIARPTITTEMYLNWPSMTPDIALGTLLSAIAIGLTAINRFRVSSLLSLVALTLALMAIIEHFTGMNVRLDLLAAKYQESPTTLHSNQTSLSSAVCLFAISLVVLVHPWTYSRWITTFIKFIVSGILAYALVAYIGHLIGLEGTYSRNNSTGVTIYAAGAIIFLLLGYATLATAKSFSDAQYQFDFSIVAIGTVISVVLWLALIQEEHDNVEEALELYASKFDHTLKSSLSQCDLAVQRLVRRWSLDPELSHQQWNADASSYFAGIGGYDTFIRLDNRRNIIWTYPDNPAQTTLADPLGNPRLLSLLDLTQKKQQPVYSGLLNSSDNKYTIASIHSVWREQKLLGYYVFFISVSKLLDYTVQQYAGEIDFQVQNENKIIYSSKSPPINRLHDNSRVFRILWNDTEFFITLLPSLSYVEKFHTMLPSLVLIMGISFSILTGVSIWLYRERNRKLVEVNNEIHARKIAQTRLENLIAYSPNGILLVDGTAKIVLVNNAVKNMFGYTEGELINRNVDFLIPDKFRHQHGIFVSEFIKHPSPRKMGEGREVFGVRKNGEEFPVEIGLTPIELDTDVQVICSIVDISKLKSSAQKLLKTQDALMNLLIDTKQAQIELENKQNELKATNKELEQFAYVASHDLQEPLRKLVSFSQLLPQDIGVELNENARKDLFYIQDSAERMRSLVQDLLTLSHAGMSALSISECSLDTIVDDVLSMLSSSLDESGARIIRTSLPKVQCDRRLITQLYQNLISNALKFVPAGTTPEIEITLEKQNNERLVFGVKDNGIGIKPHHRERIFVPFKRLHSTKEYKGTGIGLSICKKAVERHGGVIWVESGEIGTHFKFTLGK